MLMLSMLMPRYARFSMSYDADAAAAMRAAAML